MRIVYAICIIFVVYLILGTLQDGAFSGTSTQDPRLRTYEELKGQKDNLQVPKEWRFLARSKGDQGQGGHREFFQKVREKGLASARQQKQVTEDVANLAESMREKNEALSKQPISPLLKLGMKRKHPNQTYEPTDLQDLKELEEKSAWNSPQDSGIQLRLSKPVNEEPEVLPENADAPVIEAIPTDPEPENGAGPEAPGQDQTEESTDLTTNSTEIPALQESVPQMTTRIHPGFQHKVRISQPNQESAETLLKFLDEEPENVEESVGTETQDSSRRPYNHEEGMDILRKFNNLARERLESYSRDVHDYSLFLYKWDMTNSSSDGMDVMFVKLRENPYSIYVFSHLPKRSEGREMLYWDGHYDGKLLVNSGPNLWNRTLLFRPDSSAIQSHSTRSVLNLGFRKLLQELIEISEKPEAFQDAEIRYYDQAKVGQRACYALEVTFPKKTPEQTFYQIQIFVDRELTLPIQIVIYDWPEKGKSPKVMECYTYVIQQMNPGFQDRDFCHLNPEYGFKSYVPELSENERDFMKMLIPSAE
ncbi:MAG: DUF1571 domain-containing protein [Thermoguttaceae bacterium]|nr:DUF1571 domain-containing protein [Thermoguttaceae bacterium]